MQKLSWIISVGPKHNHKYPYKREAKPCGWLGPPLEAKKDDRFSSTASGEWMALLLAPWLQTNVTNFRVLASEYRKGEIPVVYSSHRTANG